jgi:hypothetical protein
MSTLLLNDPLIVACLAWVLAQLSKLLIVLLRERQLQLAYLTSAGGMPSSHSAVVVALAMRVAIDEGVDSPLFAIAFVFAGVVLYDAAGIRRAEAVQRAAPAGAAGTHPIRGVRRLAAGAARRPLVVTSHQSSVISSQTEGAAEN